ncbi:MAG TPA: tetratricopeptide repeat protein [Steroidobacteraceae bacterium]|jgi:tetratricopeptide (TPR) repeat protein|nr:tetratricopeptide repeat protein [Steroidobacteraceae bacterium]
MKRRTLHLLGIVLAGITPLALAAPPVKAPTIGDLDTKAVPVHPDTKPPGGGASKAMENYREFLKLQNADPKLRVEALRRLGDLNLESGELERMASEVTQIDRSGAEAIRLYTLLLKGYPNYPRNDQVLYQLARAYETTGQPELALSTLDSIVARYPQSRDIAEVQFRRGELLFSAKHYADSERAYAAIIAKGRGGSTFYAQSLYKHGWSLFKQGQNEQSLESFGKLLDIMLTDASGSARSLESLSRLDRELVEDTLRVMSITFSYLDGPKSIDDFMSHRPSATYAYLLYSRLGDLLVEKQRYQDAATAYRAFVTRDPVDEHAPLLTTEAIEAYRKGGFADLVLDGKLEYVQRYGFDAPFWKNRQRSASPQVVADLKTNLRDVAEYYHASAQKTKNAEDYAAAAHWYRVYLSSFPNDADTASSNYLLADALFESRQYADAATEFERTAYDYPRNARSAEAAYAALVALQKQEEASSPDARAVVHQREIESSLKFAQTFPEHPQSPVILTRAAQDLYAAGDQARASDIAKVLLARTPPVDAAKQRIAWTIVGQVAFNQNDYVDAESAFEHALAAAAPTDPERSDLTERIADAVYKQGEAKRTAGDQAGAAKDFLRVAQVAPSSKVVGTAQYDAAAALINAQQWELAIPVLEAYRHDYPKSEYATDVDRKLAVAYVAAGRSAAAAAEFEHIASDPKQDPAVVHEAVSRAADLYAQQGDTAHAVPLLERLVRDYPTPVADAIEVRQRLLDIATKADNVERERYWQREIVKADANAGAGRTERTHYLAAKAQLVLTEPERDAFRSIKLVAPLKQSLVAKKKAMEAAVQAYKQVAAYEVAETTTAATYETAELYRTLAKDLLQSERPKKLSAEEREQYDSLLEEQAYPFEEQAISIHELNTKRATEGVYDDSVIKSFAALAELKPARYGKTEQSGVPDTQASRTPVPADLQPAIELGMQQRSRAELAESETSLRHATELAPDSAMAWDELGLTLRREGKFADAHSAYDRAIVADDSYAAAHRNEGVLLDLYLDDPTAALAQFERYKELTSEDKPVSTWIAELRTRTGIKAPAPPATPAAPDAVPATSSDASPDAAPAAAPQTAAPVTEESPK